MADKYKEGVDFEWIQGNAGKSNFKTRRFFTKSEKAARAAPAKEKPKAPPAAAKKAAPAPSKAVTKDAMAGYRAGDVTSSRINAGGRGDGRAEMIVRAANKAISKAETTKKTPVKLPERPVSPTPSKAATGRSTKYEMARLGNITKEQWDSMTPAQRAAKGLPVSWVDYVRSGGNETVRPSAPTGGFKSNYLTSKKK